MFGIDSVELLVIAVVALVVIGPKDLPRVMRTIGNFVGKARGMAKHFRSGFDTMIREAELEDMEKKWKSDNDRIMREHPAPTGQEDWPEPVADEPAPDPDTRPRARTRASTDPKALARPKAPPPRGKATPRGAAPPKAAPPAGETP